MNKVLYKFYKSEGSIYVKAPINFLKEVAHELYPFIYCEAASEVPLNSWTITLSEEVDEKDKGRKISFQIGSLDEPEREYIVYEDKKIIYIRKPLDLIWRKQLVLRIIRDCLKNILLNNGMIYLHGAFVVYEHKGICILGDKRSGKTTSVLNLLSHQNSQFLSNDDVSIKVSEKNTKAFGWPRSISVRKDSFDALKKAKINYKLEEMDLAHPYNNKQSKLSDEYITFYPNEFSELTNSLLTESSNLDCVIFTKFGQENSIKEIGYKDGCEKLRNYIVTDINRYFKELEDYFKNKKKENLEISDIIRKDVKFLEVSQNFNNLRSLSESLGCYLE